MDKLLSVEFLVKTVLFYSDKVKVPPHSKDIQINVKLGGKINFKIVRDQILDETGTDSNAKAFNDNTTYTLYAGQSAVIPISEADMKNLHNEKFEIEVTDLNKVTVLGTCSLEIPQSVVDFIISGKEEPPDENEDENAQKTKPNNLDEAIRIEQNGQRMGIIEVHVRFTNFGGAVMTSFQTFDNEDRRKYFFKNEMCDQGFQIQKVSKGIAATASKYSKASKASRASVPMAPLLGHSEIEGTAFKPLYVNPFKEHASVMVSVFRSAKDSKDEEDDEKTAQRRREQQLTPSKIRKLLCNNRYCPVAMKFRDLGIGPFAPLVPNLGAPTGREEPNKLIGMSQMYGTDEYYGPYGLLKQKNGKCVCVEGEVREYREPCDCIRRTSEWDLKETCGYGRCPFCAKIETYNNTCCMRGSDESVFFVPGYVPKKREHCQSSICSVPMSVHRCECTADDPTENHVPCESGVCPRTIIKKSCDCQKDFERMRGGRDDLQGGSSKTEKPECSIPKSQSSKSLPRDPSHDKIKKEKASTKSLHSDDSKISLRKVAPAVYPRLRAGTDTLSTKCGCNKLNELGCANLICNESWSPRHFPNRKDDIDDELECDGWDEEEIFFNKRLVQSYGFPAPTLRDPKIPRCLGGSKPCDCKRAPPKPDCCGVSTRRSSRTKSSFPPGCVCYKDSLWCGPCEPPECSACADILDTNKMCGQFSCPIYKLKKDLGVLAPSQCAFGYRRISSGRDDPHLADQLMSMENCGYPKCPALKVKALLLKKGYGSEKARSTKRSACTQPDCPFRFTDCAAANLECSTVAPPKVTPTKNLGKNEVDPRMRSGSSLDELFSPLDIHAINEGLIQQINSKESNENREVRKNLFKKSTQTFVSEWYDGTLNMNRGYKPEPCITKRCNFNKVVPNWCPHRNRKIQEQIKDRIMCYFLTGNNCSHTSTSRLRGGMNDLYEQIEEYLEDSEFCTQYVYKYDCISITSCGKNNIRLRAGMDDANKDAPGTSKQNVVEGKPSEKRVQIEDQKSKQSIPTTKSAEDTTTATSKESTTTMKTEDTSIKIKEAKIDALSKRSKESTVTEKSKEVKVDELENNEELCEVVDADEVAKSKERDTLCGSPSCPQAAPRKGEFGTYKRDPLNVLDKNLYEFEPFYIKPVPRYSFRKRICGDPTISSKHVECTSRLSTFPCCVDPANYQPTSTNQPIPREHPILRVGKRGDPFPPQDMQFEAEQPTSTNYPGPREYPKLRVGKRGDPFPPQDMQFEAEQPTSTNYPMPREHPILRVGKRGDPFPPQDMQFETEGLRSRGGINICGCKVTDPSSDPGANVLNVGGWQGPKADACGCSIKDKPTVGEKADVCGCSIQDNNAQYYDKIGYCGMPSCPFFNAMDQSCGNAMCPNLQADIPGVQLGETNPYMVKRLVTLESCGSPTCPFSNPDTLDQAFTEITAEECSNTAAFYAPTTPSTDRDREEEFRAAMGFNQTPGPVEKLDKLEKMENSMNNYISSNAGEGENDGGSVKRVPRGTCKKTTCKRMIRCQECGGVSISGATCNNPNVPFDPKAVYEETYEVDEETERRREERRAARKAKKEAAMQPVEKPPTTLKVKHPVPKNTRFSYRGGKYYPGIHIGHRTCFQTVKNVPKNMGWLWTLPPGGRLKKRNGWRPGVLARSMMERIKTRREEQGIPDPPELKIISKKKTSYGQESEESEEEVEPKPTLYIKKKEGAYYITVHPLKDPRTVVEREDPYLNCTPMQFVITRRKPVKPPSISSLQCENGSEESEEDSIDEDECLCDEQEPEPEVSSSSDSELSIEFTTPAGLIFPEDMKRKPNIVHTEIQYKEADLNDPDLPCIIIQKKKKKKGVRF